MQTLINFLYKMVIINLVLFQGGLGLGNLEILGLWLLMSRTWSEGAVLRLLR